LTVETKPFSVLVYLTGPLISYDFVSPLLVDRNRCPVMLARNIFKKRERSVKYTRALFKTNISEEITKYAYG
jgi:hypothetical protein